MKEKLALSFLILLILFSGCASIPTEGLSGSLSPTDPSESSQSESTSENNPNKEDASVNSSPLITTGEISEIKATEIEKFICDSATPIAIMKNGDMVLWGGNVFYGAGNGRGGSDDVEPAPITIHHFPSPIVDAHSSVVSYAIAENGDLYGWGLNYYNQLGSDKEYFSSPQKLDFGFCVRQAISSGAFSLFLSEEGKVYCTGLDITKYQSLSEFNHDISGYYDEEPETNLRMLDLPFKCKRVANCAIIYVFLSEDGEVYYQGLLLGDHSYTSSDFYSRSPQKINFPEKIIDIAVTDFNVIALSESGKVYVYGHPLSGISDEKIDIRLDEDLYQKNLNNIVSISSGEFVVMAISQEGRVYCWGLDKYGIVDEKNNTGDPPTSFELISEPRDMGYSNVVSGMIGGYNGTVLCKDGTAHIWGNNDIGQIIEFQ